MAKYTFEPGDMLESKYPFVREMRPIPDDNFQKEVPQWRPGVDYELQQPDGGWSIPICHGWGWREITVVSRHKPGHYPERTFYTRQWIDPDGKAFGKKNLRMITTRTIVRWIKQGHPFKWPNVDHEIELRRFELEAAA